MKQPSVLCRESQTNLDLENYNATELKKLAQFWVGKEAAKFRRDESLKALKTVFKDPKAVRDVVAILPSPEQTILGIYSRFGPTVSGAVVSAELEARGLSEPEEKQTSRYYGSYHSSRNDKVSKLRDKLLLISRGRYSDGYYSSYSARRYPELTLNPLLEGHVPPASPVVWKSSAKPPRARSGGFRSSAEVALELWQVADALQSMGNWKTLKSGSLSKASQNRLHKQVGFPTVEPFVPPDAECLYYELLLELDLLNPESSQVDLPRLRKLFEEPIAVQVSEWVRAWMGSLPWQDGVGLVPDRDSHYDPVRIDPPSLWKARELLAWALSCLAHTKNDWLDLETFLADLWQSTRKDEIDFYWHSYVWQPGFSRSRNKEKLKDEERLLAYWLDDEGQWAANALWVTLWSLGLIERGHSDDKAAQQCFRLTELGRLVFGSPDIDIPDQSPQTPCLTVQPNNEVVAYLDSADARQISTLARFADRSSTGGQVQTLTLSRESVYRGLESGLSAEEIQSFLTDNSRTPIPDNVRKSLWDWAGKRESLVLRTGISLAIAPSKADLPKQHTGRLVRESFFLLEPLTPAAAAKAFKNWTIQNHATSLAKVWTVSERGELQTEGRNSLSQARLTMLADHKKQGWHITEKSVVAAKNQGLSVDQMLSWLEAHLKHKTPPLLETALRGWTGRTSAFVGEVPLLQVTRTQVRDAILASPAFRPLIAGHIPPDWFLVEPGRLADVKRLLKELGITLADSYLLAPPETSAPQKASSSRKGRKRRKS